MDRGGVNLDLLNRLTDIENQINNLKKHATTQEFGLSKISSATDVTEQDSGLVLSAVQNNPSVNGTIMNRLEREIDYIKRNFYSFDNNSKATFATQGDDLDGNKYRVPGNYFCDRIDITNTLLNCPVKNKEFTMKVELFAVNQFFIITQTIKTFEGGYIYYRNHNSFNWEPWVVIKTEAIT